SLPPGISTFPKIGQYKKIQGAPVMQGGKMQHRLTQFIFAIGRFDPICLVNNIDQMLGFGDAPEYPINTQVNFPVVTYMKIFQFANIKMTTLRIFTVFTIKRAKTD